VGDARGQGGADPRAYGAGAKGRALRLLGYDEEEVGGDAGRGAAQPMVSP
jgi:hypothetical protein